MYKILNFLHFADILLQADQSAIVLAMAYTCLFVHLNIICCTVLLCAHIEEQTYRNQHDYKLFWTRGFNLWIPCYFVCCCVSAWVILSWSKVNCHIFFLLYKVLSLLYSHKKVYLTTLKAPYFFTQISKENGANLHKKLFRNRETSLVSKI